MAIMKFTFKLVNRMERLYFIILLEFLMILVDRTRGFLLSHMRQIDGIRLVDGVSDREGRVEVNMNGTWGTLSGDFLFEPLIFFKWNTREDFIEKKIQTLRYICRKLGFPDYMAKDGGFQYGPGSGPIYTLRQDFDNTTIFYAENCFKRYPYSTTTKCLHKYDLSISCTPVTTPELDWKIDNATQMLLVYRNQSWGTIERPYWYIFNTKGKIYEYINGRIACKTLGPKTAETESIESENVTYAVIHVPSQPEQYLPATICTKHPRKNMCSFKVRKQPEFNIKNYKTTVIMDCQQEIPKRILKKELRQCVTVSGPRKYYRPGMKETLKCPHFYDIRSLNITHGTPYEVFGDENFCDDTPTKTCIKKDSIHVQYAYDGVKNFVAYVTKECKEGRICYSFDLHQKRYLYKTCKNELPLARIIRYECVPVSNWTQKIVFYGFQKTGKMHMHYERTEMISNPPLHNWFITDLKGKSMKQVAQMIACDQFKVKRAPIHYAAHPGPEIPFPYLLLPIWGVYLKCSPLAKSLSDCSMEDLDKESREMIKQKSKLYQRKHKFFKTGYTCGEDTSEPELESCAPRMKVHMCESGTHIGGFIPDVCCGCRKNFKDPITLFIKTWGSLSLAARSLCIKEECLDERCKEDHIDQEFINTHYGSWIWFS